MPDLTFGEAADWFERQSEDFDDGFRDAERVTADDAFNAANRLSSGPFSLKDLRKKDHPYARRHGAPQLEPGIINKQSGTFLSSWVKEGPVDVSFIGEYAPGGGSTGLQTTIYNTDPKAPYLEQPDGGPKTLMFKRTVDERIENDIAARREARIEHVLDELTS